MVVFFTTNPNPPSPANSISAAADVDDVPFSMNILLADEIDEFDYDDDVDDLGRLHSVTMSARFDDDDDNDGDE